MEDKDVVLLRHFVMDQMYALLARRSGRVGEAQEQQEMTREAYTPPLDAGAFGGDRGYVGFLQKEGRKETGQVTGSEHLKVITYYDAPLQAQNRLRKSLFHLPLTCSELQAGIQPSWSDQNGPAGASEQRVAWETDRPTTHMQVVLV